MTYIYLVVARSQFSPSETENIGVFSDRKRAQTYIDRVAMPQRECLEVHKWGVNRFTSEPYWAPARVVSAKTLWKKKRGQQARDRALATQGKLTNVDVMLIKPKMVRGAAVHWPNVSLVDKPRRTSRDDRSRRKRRASSRAKPPNATGGGS